MLRDRYEPQNLFELVAALRLKMEPVLARLDELLDDDVLFQRVRGDLAQRYPHTQSTGRPSTPVEVLLRMIIIKHLYGWSYEETEYNVNDSLVLRQFCRVYLNAVPDDTTLIKWANLIRPETLHELLDHVTEMARSLKVTRGRKLRTDGTVVETNIHHPTDSTLLGDAVQVLSRTLKKAHEVLKDQTALSRDSFRDRTRSARRQVKRIMEAARLRGESAADQMQSAYRRLLDTARASRKQAQRVAETLNGQADERATRIATGWPTCCRGSSASSTRPCAGCWAAKKFRRTRSWSACSSRRRPSSVRANPHGPPSSAAWFGWTRWRAVSSAATGSWTAIPAIASSCGPAWTITSNSLSIHPTCWRVTGASTQRPMNATPKAAA